VTLLPTREGIRIGLVPSLVGRVRVGFLYSKKQDIAIYDTLTVNVEFIYVGQEF
jgi:hypothetical protein